MKAPQAVVFDLGKVLLDFDYRIFVSRLLRRGSITADALEKLLLQSPLLLQYEAGAISTQDFIAQVKSATGFDGDANEFEALFGDIFTVIPAMIQMHAELRQRGVPSYIFSNTNEMAVAYIRKRFSFFQDFDGYVYSYEHKAMKPDERLYQVVERCAGRQGADLFYLDDRPENIATGLNRGWQAVVHETPEKSRAALVRAGLLS